MVICANCMQYADNTRSTCEHCGVPLREHSREELTRFLGIQPEIAELAIDQERAQLIASGVVAASLPHFFFDDGQHRTVLVSLFGSPRTPRRTAEALLFSAVVYLIEQRYCDLVSAGEEQEMEWVELRPWGGQVRSLEGMLAARAESESPLPDVLDQVVREAMGFHYEVVKSPLIRMPGMPELPPVRDRSDRTALRGMVELGKRAVLPDHEEDAASAEIYRILLTFAQVYPQRARYLAEKVRSTFDWFVEYEKDPSVALLRDR